MKMGGGAKPFGVDAAEVPALVRRLIDAGAAWRGFHIFAGSQALDAGAIADTQAQTVALAARLANDIVAPPPPVNLGGRSQGRRVGKEGVGKWRPERAAYRKKKKTKTKQQKNKM